MFSIIFQSVCSLYHFYFPYSYKPVLKWAQPVAVVGLVQQLGPGVAYCQNFQEVHVKGSKVTGDNVVECHG
jgi:hypothetical protein